MLIIRVLKIQYLACQQMQVRGLACRPYYTAKCTQTPIHIAAPVPIAIFLHYYHV